MAATGAGALHSWHSRKHFVQAAGLSESFELMVNVKRRIADYHVKHGVMPHSNEQAELLPARSLYGTEVKQISVNRGGHVFVDFDEKLGARSMVFSPSVSVSNGALTWQCTSDSIDIQVLEKLKPSCQSETATANSRLMSSIVNKDPVAFDAAIGDGADVDAVTRGNTPLMLAATIGDISIVERLLNAGAEIDQTIESDEHQSALMVAIDNDNEKVVGLLLAAGASITLADHRERSALDYAIAKDQELGGNRFVVQISARLNPRLAGALAHTTLSSAELLAHEEELYLYHRELRQAASECHVIRMATLFDQHSESNASALVDGLPLQHHTQKSRCSAVLTRYIKSKPVYQSAVQARFALAVRECDVQQIESMLKLNGALVVEGQHGGISHIDRAIKNGCAELVTIFSRLGEFEFVLADDVLIKAISSTPQSKLVSMVGALIEAGANVDGRDAEGRSPLIASISLEHPVIARYLITAGAAVNGIPSDTVYPLVEASKKGYLRVVTHLINEGVKIDVQDRLGRTALMAAVNREHAELVSLLLNAGANIKLRDIHGVDAVVVAQTNRQTSIKNLLLASGS